MAKRPASKPRPAATAAAPALDPDMLRRVAIEAVEPQVDCGRFPIKRVTGETVTVTADILADGHDAVAAVVLYRRAGEETWREVPMAALGNDRWSASFVVEASAATNTRSKPGSIASAPGAGALEEGRRGSGRDVGAARGSGDRRKDALHAGATAATLQRRCGRRRPHA